MKLLVSVLEDGSAGRVADAMVAGGFGVTRINTVGGFLRRGNATLLAGVEDDRVEAALQVMRAAYAQHRPSSAGPPSGPVFVLDVESLIRM